MTNESIQLLYNHFQESSERWANNNNDVTAEYKGYCKGRSETYADAAHVLATYAALNGIILEPYIAKENIIS